MEIIALIIIILILLVIAISAIDNNRLIVSRYLVSSEKIKKDCTIAFLSDLHGNTHGPDNQKLIEAVNAANPDIIVMGGDMITSRAGEAHEAAIKRAVDLVGAFAGRKVFYGIGNHEYRMYLYREDFGDNFDRLTKGIHEAGAILLRNEHAYLDEYNIDIQGLEIERKYYKRGSKVTMEPSYIREMTGEKNKDHYRILMAHNPEFFEAYSHEADLVLSGHFHGGIVRLPFIGGMVSARLSLFPKYDGGIYDLNGTKMVVSKGLGSHTLPLRIFNPCELCIIDIKKV